jgi:hypothetical protein
VALTPRRAQLLMVLAEWVRIAGNSLVCCADCDRDAFGDYLDARFLIRTPVALQVWSRVLERARHLQPSMRLQIASFGQPRWMARAGDQWSATLKAALERLQLRWGHYFWCSEPKSELGRPASHFPRAHSCSRPARSPAHIPPEARLPSLPLLPPCALRAQYSPRASFAHLCAQEALPEQHRSRWLEIFPTHPSTRTPPLQYLLTHMWQARSRRLRGARPQRERRDVAHGVLLLISILSPCPRHPRVCVAGCSRQPRGQEINLLLL